MLLLLSFPSHLLLIMVIKLLHGHFELTIYFVTSYLIIGGIQVAILQQIAYILVNYLWKKGYDPDNYAIPFLTAFADLLGSVLLALAFSLLFHLNDVNGLDITTPVNQTLYLV